MTEQHAAWKMTGREQEETASGKQAANAQYYAA